MAERLLWEASYPAGAESAGLDIGERVNDQLKDYIMLNDLLDKLQCICDGIGAGTTYTQAQDYAANAPGVLPTEWAEYTYPSLGEGVSKLYDKPTWAEALSQKCQLAQHFVDAVLDNLDWLVDNWETNLSALEEINRWVSQFLGKYSPWAPHLWDWIVIVQQAAFDWAVQAKADMTGLRDQVISIIYDAEQPEDAAVEIINRVPSFVITRPVLTLMLRYGVWEGQYPGAVGPIDASSYDPNACTPPSSPATLGVVYYTYFNNLGEEWNQTGQSSNWQNVTAGASVNYVNHNNTLLLNRPSGINVARSNNNSVYGNYGTTTLVVPAGASTATISILAYPEGGGVTWSSDNKPAMNLSGSVSGSYPSSIFQYNGISVVPLEILTLTLKNIDAGALSKRMLCGAIYWLFN